MRHDSHFVDELAKTHRSIGKILPVDEIFPNPNQPRSEIGDLEELTASIKEQGVLEPLLVRPKGGKWMIIAGERRWRSSKLAGLEEVPCIELDIDDKTVAEIALVENLQRKDLDIWEIADGLKALADRFEYTHDQIARKIGKSRSSVTESLAIAGLPESVRTRCKNLNIEAKTTLVEISREFDEAAMNTLLDKVASGAKPVARDAVRESKQNSTPKQKKLKDTSES
ncbi:MAG: ParB/RepB/Spo0J family partition protein, partial [Acidobacteriota bacterium]|nr:ParB/RepB/Spo0J family partition protein [Acidobacteriota bacterium]